MQLQNTGPATVAGQQNFGGVGGNAAIGLLMQQIGSAQWNNYQVLRWIWYDYVSIFNTAASTNPLTFFAVAQGSADPVSGRIKTLEQTNMTQQGQFGQQYFVIQQIRMHLNGLPKARQNGTVSAEATFGADQLIFANRFRAMLSTGVLQVNIAAKLYYQNVQPLRVMPPGFGLDDGVVVPYASEVNAAGNAYIAQSNSMDDVYDLGVVPQMIEPTQTFTAQMSFPDLGYDFHNVYATAGQPANVECGLILDGYTIRPVQ